MSQTEKTPPVHSSTGDLLRRTRIQQGLTVEEVAGRLYLLAAQIESLESDRYDQLPGDVFVKGFLRNYAKLVGLDADAVIRGYSHQTGQGGWEASQRLIPEAETPLMEHNWRTALWATLILVVLGGAASYFYNRPAESLQDLFSASTEPASTAPLERAALEPAPAEAAVAETVSVAAAVSAVAAGVSADMLPTVAALSAVPAETVAQGLDMQFSDQSWVEVVDANQQVLFRRLTKPGETASLEGLPPFQIKLGNAEAARIQYHGNAVEIPVQSPGKTVRLTVGP